MNRIKRVITLFLAFAMVICFIPSMGMQKAYAETDVITRVDIETGADLPETIIAGYPVDQPTFTVINVESELGTVKPSDMVFETGEYYGWCQSTLYGDVTDWFKYAEDGIQDLFFTSGESRMMVDIFADPDKVSALFTEDTKVYLNGQLMSFYKLYADDEDYVGYLPYTAIDPISRIDFTLDTDAFDFNTAYTDDEMDDLIRGAFGYDYSMFYCRSWQGLYYKYVSEGGQVNWWSCNESDEYLDPSKEYAVGVSSLSIYSYVNKYWPYSVRSCNNMTLAGEVDGFDIYLNGEKRNDAWLEGWDTDGDVRTYLYIPLGSVSTAPIARSVTIQQPDVSVKKGGSYTFSAEVEGTVTDKSVTWSVENAFSSQTTISTAGVLTVGEDETAETITIRATSNGDPRKSDQRTVTVLDEDPVIESVRITPVDPTLYPGTEKQFSVEVTGTQTDKSVTWGISGTVTSSLTSISNTGLLKIGYEEEATAFRVTAVSNADPVMSDSVLVYIKKPEKISEIRYTLDKDAFELNPAYTGDEMDDIIRSAFSYDSSVFYCRGWMGLYYKYINDDGDISWFSCNESDEYIDLSREYAAGVSGLSIDSSSGKDWPDSVKSFSKLGLSKDVTGFEVYLNDEKRDDAFMQAANDHGDIRTYFYIPLKFNLTRATVTGISGKTYDGKSITQSPTVKLYGNTLKKDSDYTITYKDSKGNAIANPTKADTYMMIITGIGNFEGTIEKTFKISPRSFKKATITLSASKYTYNGSVKKPTITVKDTLNGTTKKLVAGTDYTMTIKNSSGKTVSSPKNVDRYRIEVKGKGNYSGTKTVSYKINPKGTTLLESSNYKVGKTYVTVKWNKQSTKMSSKRITGYQVKLATNSKFTKGKKTVTVSGYTKASKKVTGLKSGKKYYVKIRTYKVVTVDGKKVKLYSPWSKVKTVTTKK